MLIDNTNKSASQIRMIRLTQVMDKIGMGRSWVYQAMNEGKFPRPITFGGRAIAWIESEVDGWLESQVEASRKSKNTNQSLQYFRREDH
jgi:prophage regulatory protein